MILLVQRIMAIIVSAGRRLFLLVAFFATIQALLHSHALADSDTVHASAPAQSCVLCVSSATAMLAVAVHLPPPAFADRPATASRIQLESLFSTRSLPSRAPPQL
jgi:hypothetical protein